MAALSHAYQPNLSGIVPGPAAAKAPHHLLSMGGMGATVDAAMKKESRAEDKRQAKKFATPTPAMMKTAVDAAMKTDDTMPLTTDAYVDPAAGSTYVDPAAGSADGAMKMDDKMPTDADGAMKMDDKKMQTDADAAMKMDDKMQTDADGAMKMDDKMPTDVIKGALPITTGPAKHKKPLLVFPTKGEVNEDPPAVSNTAVSPVSPVNPVKKANPVAHISLWVTLCLLHTRTTPNPRMLLR